MPPFFKRYKKIIKIVFVHTTGALALFFSIDMRILRFLTMVAVVLLAVAVKAQNIALKSNLLYWTTATPNLGVEMQVSPRHTIQLFYGLNPWKFSDGKSLRHWTLQPEWRHWFCQTFNGWFVGGHLMGGQFNAGGISLPFHIVSDFKDRRYEGWYAGGGISAGYQWPLSRHWNAEASLGVGYDYISYDKFKCGECGDKIKSGHTHYIGPTKAAVSLMYMF